MNDRAFKNCTALKSVRLPANITELKEDVFAGCTGLQKITIPDSVTKIFAAFKGCTGLKTIRIPDNVTSIAYGFKDCTGLTEVTVPGKVNYTDYAFQNCTGLQKATIAEGVTKIGKAIFKGCTGLQSIIIPATVTAVEADAFTGCDQLADIYFTGNKEQWDALGSSVPAGVKVTFLNGKCGDNLTWVMNSNGVLTISGSGAMYNYSKTNPAPWSDLPVSEVVFDGSAGTIGSYSFYNCTSLEKITLPATISSIGNSAFYNCTKLKEITLPESVNNIGAYAFSGCSGLTQINISDGLKTIGFEAFRDCLKLTEIHIPISVTSIGKSAFSTTSSLTIYYDGSTDQWSNICADSYSRVICQFLGSGTCGTDLSWALKNDGMLTITGSGAMDDYAAGSKMPWYSISGEIKKVVLDNRVTSIGSYAFYYCENLEELSGSAEGAMAVASIGEYAFEFCDKLKSVPFAQMGSLKTIGIYAFHKTALSGRIVFNDSLERIESNAFAATGISSVVLPAGLQFMGRWAFYPAAGQIGSLTNIFFLGTREQWENAAKNASSISWGQRVYIHCGTCQPNGATETAAAIPATCTEQGRESGTICAVCKELLAGGNAIDKEPHSRVEIPETPATEEAAGWTAGVKCSECNTVLVKPKVIPQLGTVPGDVNGDNVANISDIECLYTWLLTGDNQGKLTDPVFRKAADLTGDGVWNVYDLQRLYEIVVLNTNVPE